MATVTYYVYEHDLEENLVWSSYPLTADFKDMSTAYDAAEELRDQLQQYAGEVGQAAVYSISSPLYDLEEVWNG